MGRGAPWSDQEEAWFAANPTGNYREFVAAGFDRTEGSFRLHRHILMKSGVCQPRFAEPIQPAIVPVPMIDTHEEVVGEQTLLDDLPVLEVGDRLLDFLEQGSAIDEMMAPTQETTTFTAPDGLPIGVAFTGDWHVGAAGVEIAELRATLARLASTPGAYAVGMGDYVEGVNIHVKAVSSFYKGKLNDGDAQEAIVHSLGHQLRGRWLAFMAGNHDEWLFRHGGLSRTARLARYIGAPHFPQGGGTIFIRLGEQRWTLGVAHTHKGGSRLNSTNEQRTMFDSWPQWENCHVLAVAHRHFPEIHQVPRKGKLVTYVRCGTFKTKDDYAKTNNFTPMMGTPLLVFRPDADDIETFLDLKQGLAYLTWLRAEYGARAA